MSELFVRGTFGVAEVPEEPNVPEVPETPKVRTVRRWGDRVLVDLLKADVELVGTTNFQVVKTATFGEDGKPFFNDIVRFQVVDHAFLTSLQYPSDGYSAKQKMNWLVNTDGNGVRPYWMKGSPNLYFGPLVFGGQKVLIGEELIAWGQYPNRTREEWIRFFRLIGLRKADMDKVRTGAIRHQTHPWLIQRATEAGSGNKYIDFPRGEIFHPVWSDLDWPCNYGDGKLWVAEEFLESV